MATIKKEESKETKKVYLSSCNCTVRPRFYHRFRQRRNSDKIGVSDKIDGIWNERKPPFFLTMYVLFCVGMRMLITNFILE